MARKGTSPPEDGSPPSTAAAQRVKKETIEIKKEKLREQAADAENESDEEPSPKATKRARVNTAGDSRPGSSAPPGRAKDVSWDRDVKGYIPGSIVRVQLKNFVTYDFVEFEPGPYLNMIIGPNGTGKSSIACAIALGLNYSPSILGRATELPAFVKNDTKDGHIEIELKGKKGEPNLVIRRKISANSKSSSFSINKKAATGKEVSSAMVDLGIQVGNLCSFLPQDRVSSFAHMSPQQLLRETERAAGDENLERWHDTLISAGKDAREMNTKIDEEDKRLNQMKERNAGIERDVERFRERVKIECNIDLLETLIPVQEYRELLQRYLTAKEKQRRLHARVVKLKERNAPARAKLEALDKDHASLEKKANTLKNQVKDKFKLINKKIEEDERLDTNHEDLDVQLQRLKREEQSRATKIKKMEEEIEKVEKLLENAPGIVKQEDQMKTLGDELKEIHAEMAEHNPIFNEADSNAKEFFNRIGELQRAKGKAEKDLKSLDNKADQKLVNVERFAPDVVMVVRWLRENQGRFRKPIFEPPIISCEVTDKRFADAVEGSLSRASQLAFVAQTQEDADKFHALVNDTSETFNKKIRVTCWFMKDQLTPRRPVPMDREQLRSLGFEGYVLDYVKFPEGLEGFLMNDGQMHANAVSLNESRVNIDKAMEVYGNAGGGTFFAGKTMYRVQKSAYGRRAVSSMTSDLAAARNFGQLGNSVDPAVKQRYQDALNSAVRELTMAEEDRAEVTGAAEAANSRREELEKKKTENKRKRDAIHQQKMKRQKLEGDLMKKRNTLKTEQDAPSTEEKRERIRRDMVEITMKRIKNAMDIKGIQRDVVDAQKKNTLVWLKWLQVGANRAALKAIVDASDGAHTAAMAEWGQANAEFAAAKDAAKEGKSNSLEAKHMLENERDRVKDAFDENFRKREDYISAWDEFKNGKRAEEPDKDGVDLRTSDQMKIDLETEKTNLEMNSANNPGVIEQYEKRKKDIETTERSLDEMRRKANKIERNIQNARENWQPALEELVASIGAKFSSAFDKIGCAGEIRIREDEDGDFEKWAIDILVKFRDSEKLQLLTAQRQSGGERSLTTILYLMSLTEEARAPFSLVDEINQGMDQRAERMVHNSMVETTCKPEAGQYFLITPKLLSDLNYHERMKVLCVNNGEWLPEDTSIGSMMGLINRFVAKRRGA